MPLHKNLALHIYTLKSSCTGVTWPENTVWDLKLLSQMVTGAERTGELLQSKSHVFKTMAEIRFVFCHVFPLQKRM